MPTLKDALFLSGDLFLPKSVRSVLEQYHLGNGRTLMYVTNWSLLHVVSGLLTGYILWVYYPAQDYYWTGFLVHTAWELWQIVVKNTPFWTVRGQIDVVMDTVLFMGGMLFAHWVLEEEQL